MFKRTITALLSIFMLTAMTAAVSAASIAYELTYDISSDGKNEIVVKQGETIKVDFHMIRTDANDYFDLRSYQNEIEYNPDFFELIIPPVWDFRYSPDPNFKVADFRNNGTVGIIKISELDVFGFQPDEWIGSFELRVIGQKGDSSYVKNGRAKAASADNISSVLTLNDLKITVAEIYDVTYSEQIFDSTQTEKTAFRNIDYEGKILDSVYDELYLWTVSYEIDGTTKYVTAKNDGTFIIPGEDITGNMKLDYSKELNIKVYVEPYAPGLTLIRVEGAGEGYTFDGKRMIKAANSDNMGAWIIEGEISAEDAEGMVGVAEAASDTITESTDITQNGTTSLNDLAIVLGCSEGYYESTTAEDVTHYLLSDINGDRRVTESDYEDIVIAYKQS